MFNCCLRGPGLLAGGCGYGGNDSHVNSTGTIEYAVHYLLDLVDDGTHHDWGVHHMTWALVWRYHISSGCTGRGYSKIRLVFHVCTFGVSF